jgi:hypothetical protein
MIDPQGSAHAADEAWPVPDGTPARKPVRDPEARLDPRFGRRSIKPSVRAAYAAREDRAAIDRPAVGRSLRRAMYRFILAVLVGVSGTLGWQSYGEQMLATYAPTVAWAFSISAAKLQAAGAAVTASDSTQAAPLNSNLEAVRRSLEQLSAKQDQMVQDIAALQALEDDIRQKMSFTPPLPATVPQTAAVPQLRAPQPRAQAPAMPVAPAPRAAPAAGAALAR